MKRIFFTFFCALIFAYSGFAQQPCKEYSVPKSILTFCPPTNFTGVPTPGDMHLTFAEAGLRSSTAIVIVEAPSPLDAEATAYFTIREILADPKQTNKRLVEAIDFKTTAGVTGTKLVFYMDEGLKRVRQAWYIFQGPKGLVLQIAAVSENAAASIDGVIDASQKTVKIKK